MPRRNRKAGQRPEGEGMGRDVIARLLAELEQMRRYRREWTR